MFKSIKTTLALATLLFVAGCSTLQPKVPTADAGIAGAWPLPAHTAAAPDAAGPAAAVADIGWRDFFVDPRLQELIGRALDNNRDLRVAVLNVERARAQYRIQRAERLPSLAGNATLTRSGGDDLPASAAYSAGLGVTGFELDLFGRVSSLSDAALQQYFAQEQARRGAQLGLVAEVANAWLTLAADQELQRVAQAALANRESALALTEKRHLHGAVSGLDLSQAQTAIETARSDATRYAGQVETDRNALALLVGGAVDPALLPARFDVQASGVAALPGNLPSNVLLRRPDVLQAEHRLLAANADIGAARAAFFPSISLTGSIGSASTELSGLFGGGSGVWSFMPQINLPIFQGGRLRANLAMSTADRDIALAQYEKAIQAGFREVADALALTRSLAGQRAAQEALVVAATRADELSRARYAAGRDSYLVSLDAQRTLYAAQQSLVVTQLAEQANRVVLYKVLGGGWIERNP